MAKYYDDGANELCVACHYKCYTCASATDCIVCKSETTRLNNTPSCDCIDGDYDDGVLICVAC